MRTSYWTHRFAAAALIAVAGSTFVYAQQSGSSDRSPGARPERFRPTADDLSAFTDARIAAIKAGLRLNAEQEKNWPAFEEAYRIFAKLRSDRILAFREGPPPPPTDMLDGLQRRADTLGRSAAAYRQIADATAPLYKSLDDAQKRRFNILAPMLSSPNQRIANFRRDFFRGQNDDDRRGGGIVAPERSQPRGMDRMRGGGPERIRFEGRELQYDDSSDPGVGLARENGWR